MPRSSYPSMPSRGFPGMRLAILSVLALTTAASVPHYRDAAAPIEERVSDLMKRMTLEEKIAQTYAPYSGFDKKRFGSTSIGSTSFPPQYPSGTVVSGLCLPLCLPLAWSRLLCASSSHAPTLPHSPSPDLLLLPSLSCSRPDSALGQPGHGESRLRVTRGARRRTKRDPVDPRERLPPRHPRQLQPGGAALRHPRRHRLPRARHAGVVVGPEPRRGHRGGHRGRGQGHRGRRGLQSGAQPVGGRPLRAPPGGLLGEPDGEACVLLQSVCGWHGTLAVDVSLAKQRRRGGVAQSRLSQTLFLSLRVPCSFAHSSLLFSPCSPAPPVLMPPTLRSLDPPASSPHPPTLRSLDPPASSPHRPRSPPPSTAHGGLCPGRRPGVPGRSASREMGPDGSGQGGRAGEVRCIRV